MFHFVVFGSCLLSFFSCDGKGKVVMGSKRELEAYVLNPENGFLSKREGMRFSYSLNLHPNDLLVLDELNRYGILTDSLVYQADSLFAPYQYFHLSVSPSSKEYKGGFSSQKEYSNFIHVLSFRLGEYMCLVSGNDTLHPVSFHTSKTYGLGEGWSSLVAFNTSKQVSGFSVLLKGLHPGEPDLKFHFDKEVLKRMPSLNWEAIRKSNENR